MPVKEAIIKLKNQNKSHNICRNLVQSLQEEMHRPVQKFQKAWKTTDNKVIAEFYIL